MQIEVDLGGAIRKTAIVGNVPKANRHIVGQWASDSVRMLMRRAAGMQKSGKGKKAGQLARNIAFTVAGRYPGWTVTIGTGVGNAKSVKYADIQDKGGVTHPTVTPKLRRWAWAMYYATKSDKYKAIALTRKSRLNVRIPGSRWFTGIMDARERDLNDLLWPEHVLKTAEGMTGLGGGGET